MVVQNIHTAKLHIFREGLHNGFLNFFRFLSSKSVFLNHNRLNMETFTTRQNKIARLIQKELAGIFIRELKPEFPGLLISVTIVRITSDLSLARCYVSIYPPDKAEVTLLHIQRMTKTIRGIIGNKVAKQLRIIPEFTFYLDDSLNYLEKIDRLLEK
jgi:ribosome-binding factor A